MFYLKQIIPTFLVNFLCEYGEPDEPDLVSLAADDGVSALLDDPDRFRAVAESHNLHRLGESDVPHHQTGAGGRHYEVVGQHHQLAQGVPAGVDTVEKVSLVSLPHTQLGVLPQCHHAAGRVGDVYHCSTVGLPVGRFNNDKTALLLVLT